MYTSYRMKTTLLLCIVTLCCSLQLRAQQFALYNTGTLYDSFENPSQKAFQTDSSRKFAFNFFIPTLGLNYVANGDALPTLRKALYTGKYDTRDLILNYDNLNKVAVSQNAYMFMFRIFHTVTYQKELGFSWQVKTENYGEATNPALIVLQDYQRIVDDLESNGRENDNIFNSDIYGQSYHQFSLTYRENYNKQFAYGVKLSYLSGIAYSKLKVFSSRLEFNPDSGFYEVKLNSDMRTNFYYDDIEKKMFLPGIKNPGLAIGLSANYKSRQGWYFLANLKDLGFIRWSKKSYRYRDEHFSINANSVDDSLWHDIKGKLRQSGYTTPINGKAEVLINKDLGNYQPNLLLSKNLFYEGGDIALVNTYRYRSLNLSLSTAYNLHNTFLVGGQIMIKSPNVEFFLGTDQLFKSLDAKKALENSDPTLAHGHLGGSAYFGFALKFGRLMSRRENTNYIPGINFKTKNSSGILNRIFGNRDF